MFEHPAGFRCNNTRTSHLQSASLVKICWKFQKNGNNGEVLSYTTNTKKPFRCPVRAALQIRARAIHLGVPPHLPIAVFKNSTGVSQYIDDFHVTNMLQYTSIQHQQTK